MGYILSLKTIFGKRKQYVDVSFIGGKIIYFITPNNNHLR